MNAENIQSAQRDYLRSFAQDIERYINTTTFTSEDLDGERITCNFEVFFKTSTADNRYQVQVVVTSQRPIYKGNEKTNRSSLILRIRDDSWESNYIPNQRMTHDEMIYDPLTGFIDFYAYLIIGYDLETYIPMSGSQCFQKALRVVQLAANAGGGKDWQPNSASYSKFGITDELTNMKYNAFRNAFNDYHFEGLDMIEIDQQKALPTMLKSIETINTIRRQQNPTSVIVKQFFDAKYHEIAEAFASFPDKNVYETLSSYDEEHRKTYQEMKLK
jgi:hypothetical protein